MLNRYDDNGNGDTWFVRFKVKRPFDWLHARNELRKLLNHIFDNQVPPAKPVQVSPGITISFRQAGFAPNIRYRLGWFTDSDDTGWVIPTLVEFILRISRSKFLLTEPYREKYPIWWLVLENHISLSLKSRHSMNELLAELPEVEGWDRVLIFDPSDSTRYTEVPATNL